MSEQTEKASEAANAQSETSANEGAAGGARSTEKNTIALAGERVGLLGLKAGMTQVFTEDGAAVPVTVIDLQPNTVTQVKTKTRDGYEAVQVGLMPKKLQRTNKPSKGHFKKSGAPGFYHVKEFRVASLDGVSEGAELSIEGIKKGDLVDVTAVSKGKGFQGVMKRYNFSGGPKSHGASVCHRAPGSIGNRADPGKTFKNKKMAGHMGSVQVTIQNIRVIDVDLENRLMMINGSVPGPKNGLVTMRKAIKNDLASR